MDYLGVGALGKALVGVLRWGLETPTYVSDQEKLKFAASSQTKEQIKTVYLI